MNTTDTLGIEYKTTTESKIIIIKGGRSIFMASVEASVTNGILHLTEVGPTGSEIHLYIWTANLEYIRVLP